MLEISDQVDFITNKQPTRSGKDRPERRFDRTQLHEDVHGNLVHRDYLAHAFRWGWVTRQMKLQGHGKVLEVGCGQDLPLLKVMSGIGHQPELYVGVDLNKLPEVKRNWAKIYGEFCFHDRHQELPYDFDIAVCMEVIEHGGIGDGLNLLYAIFEHLKPGGVLYLSTPVFDGIARAMNHIMEFTVPQLQQMCEQVGFIVERRFGTFASKLDLKDHVKPEHWKIYQELEVFYDREIMSTFLAPLYPDLSRNNLWQLRKPK